jgi:hypothetical protein
MNDKTIDRVEKLQNRGSANFGRFVATVCVGHAIGQAIFVGMAGIILNKPLHQLWVTYFALVCCGLVLSPLLYWSRLARERAKTCAIRFGIAMFLYSQAILVALGFSTVRLGILPLATVIHDYALIMLFISVLASTMAYGIVRQVLKAPQLG